MKVKNTFNISILLICFSFFFCAKNILAQGNVVNDLKNKIVLYGTSVTSGDDISLKKKSAAKKQALFIFNFFKYITWPDKDSDDVFNINVMGDSGNVLLNELKELADNLGNTKKGKEMTFNINRIEDLESTGNTQILYFDQSSNLKLEDVYKKLNNQPTLVVTQGYPFGKSMINFIMG